ncbi:hypothetical protein PICST_66501 [Scheffersomyces stipitis CBS 6054]|uniref:SUN domain-containing protein n=1 Tax=Scheffersomyces stipitis (strain ATCC 58785 / CBS 6054 / NBRC 10063 / NRRL Y-11545) TaxID=322104 RepID=A3GGP0_PICST|nr:predicted protein [Scheffersomyces stipitis CBS 6054]EAZ63561.2 hypothetical protein PICST_66501 [Scheffersomyces stipitis CBS 6054]
MPGFPGVPRVVGDTDDDASIHMYNFVGPAQPLPARKSAADEKIYQTLYEKFKNNNNIRSINNTSQIEEEHASDEEFEEIDVEAMNASFDKFANKSSSYVSAEDVDANFSDSDTMNESSDDDDDDDLEDLLLADKVYETAQTIPVSATNDSHKPVNVRVREESPISNRADRYSSDSQTSTRWNRSLVQKLPARLASRNLFGSEANTSANILFDEIKRTKEASEKEAKNLEEPETTEKSPFINSENSEDIHSGSTGVGNSNSDNWFSASSFIKNYIIFLLASFIITLLALSYQASTLIPFDAARFAARFNKLDTSVKTLSSRVHDIESDRQSLSAVSIDTGKINEKLVDIEGKMEELETRLVGQKSEFNSWKESLKEAGTSISSTIENGRLADIEDKINALLNATEKSPSWSNYVDTHSSEINEYIRNQIANAQPKELQEIIKQQLEKYNHDISDKFNKLVDSLNLEDTPVDEQLLERAKNTASPILLSQIADILYKGSVTTNYADYSLGARIRGYLTRGGNGLQQEQSTVRRALFGWYRYLRIKSPNEWKYNANNVLSDSEQSWYCSSECSVGIKLSSKVILSDIVIEGKNIGKVSIWLRPTTKQNYDRVLAYQQKYKIVSDSDESAKNGNRYLSKYVKVSEASVATESVHIKLPVSVVNLQIPVGDIYVEFTPSSSADGDRATEVNSIKVYGISGINTHQSSELNSLLNKIFAAAEEKRSETGIHREGSDVSDILGEDYTYIV